MVRPPNPNDPGLLSPPQVSLLIDQYELTMSASYLRQGMNEPAVFELFVRRLPPNRDWLLAAGLGPTLRLIAELRFGERELDYLRSLGFRDRLPRLPGRLPLLEAISTRCPRGRSASPTSRWSG